MVPICIILVSTYFVGYFDKPFKNILKQKISLEKLFGFPLFMETNLFGYSDHTSSFYFSFRTPPRRIPAWQSSQVASPNKKKCLVFLRWWICSKSGLPTISEERPGQRNESLNPLKENKSWSLQETVLCFGQQNRRSVASHSGTSYCDQVLLWCCSSLFQACFVGQMWYIFFHICRKFYSSWTDKSDTSTSFWYQRLRMSSAFIGAYKRKILFSSPTKWY